jgi:hypothetical protein
MRSELFKTNMAEVYIEDGIMHIYLTQETMELEPLKKHMATLKAHFSEHLPMPSVVNNGKTKSTPKNVRDYLASDEVGEILSSSALVVNSALTKIAVNLFLQFSKPKYPVKMFTDTESAIKWVSQFKK